MDTTSPKAQLIAEGESIKVLQPTGIFEEAESALRDRNISKALRLYDLAEQNGLDPDACCAGRWLCHALLGDFPSAWKESDSIEQRGKPDGNRFWDGNPLDGSRVLIRCLHGLGDTLQYVRYAPELRERTNSLTIEAQPALKSLLAASDLADRVITWGETEGEWDRQIEIVELPRIFRSSLPDIPQSVPYLKVGAEQATRKKGEALRVGFVWVAGSYDPTRSLALSELAPLCRMPGVQFFSFQAGLQPQELTECCPRMEDSYDRSGCVLTAATRLMHMHLLITVDTMMAHLAGALALPVWTLLPATADWRWMLGRSDSPWYPSMRLFRQTEAGNWSQAVQQIQVELASLADLA